ncbi:MAG: 50S ribosomal protein L23 [Candidatus Babeliales bacterium]
MELALTNVILGPVLSDKAYKLNQDEKVLVLNVHPKANKPMVKEAIEKLFNAKVDEIRIMNRKGKTKRIGRFQSRGKLQKRAIVKLKEGYSISLMDQSVAEEADATSVKKD